MGRAFEYRKARKLKRWGNMARTFTKIGKEIEIAVKSGGPDPTANVRLRILIQNAKAENMPKENVERAIKRAISKDTSDYKEVVYEGYGPHGIAFLVETATDNTNRTVASMRMYFNKCGGALGTSGSVAFMFEHKCSFKFRVPAGTDFEELELNMIDTGVDDFCPEDETTVTVEAPYEQFGTIQKWLEDNGFEIVSGESLRVPTDTKELDAEITQSFAAMVRSLLSGGVTVLMVSHDVEFCACYAHRCALFFDGSISAEGTPRAFFGGNSFYTTSADRMARDICPQAVTAEDVMAVIGGTVPPEPVLEQVYAPLPPVAEESAAWQPPKLPWWRRAIALVSGLLARGICWLAA